MTDNEGCVEGWLLGWDDGCDEERPDELGRLLDCDVGTSGTEGFSDHWPIGILVSKDWIEGYLLCSNDGCEVGQSETEGFIDICLLGCTEG